MNNAEHNAVVARLVNTAGEKHGWRKVAEDLPEDDITFIIEKMGEHPMLFFNIYMTLMECKDIDRAHFFERVMGRGASMGPQSMVFVTTPGPIEAVERAMEVYRKIHPITTHYPFKPTLEGKALQLGYDPGHEQAAFCLLEHDLRTGGSVVLDSVLFDSSIPADAKPKGSEWDQIRYRSISLAEGLAMHRRMGSEPRTFSVRRARALDEIWSTKTVWETPEDAAYSQLEDAKKSLRKTAEKTSSLNAILKQAVKVKAADVNFNRNKGKRK